jgi:L-alanine-DL-glutamate epimerase-like enolase superfamily enzyme
VKITGGHACAADDVPLTRPYAVANHATDARQHGAAARRTATDRCLGLGAATPEPEVNGDTMAAAFSTSCSPWPTRLRGREVGAAGHVRRPAGDAAFARGAHGARHGAARSLGAFARKPLVDLLGRVHTALPTSVTIGIGDVAMTLREAGEYVGRGFTVLKVKIGEDLELDVERLVRLREQVGSSIALRVDGNVGYRPAQLLPLLQRHPSLGLEFVEQPLPHDRIDAQRLLPPALAATLMADESLHDVADAQRAGRGAAAVRLWNVKLVKCGGIGRRGRSPPSRTKPSSA